MLIVFICILAGPPNIRKGGQCKTIFNGLIRQCNVGANYCISNSDTRSLIQQYRIECLHDPTAPVTLRVRAMWFINYNGMSIEHTFPFLIGFYGQILVIPGHLVATAASGNYTITCKLTNTAGSDEASSLISDCSK